MSNRIVLLGTGTCQLQPHRMGSSVLVELGDTRLVFDFGRGITHRLVEQGLEQDDVEHIVLSHFHPDHLSDLIPYLHAAAWSQIDPRNKDLHIYGPVGLEVQLMRLLSLFGPSTMSRDAFDVHLHEIHDDHFTLAGRRFGFVDLPPADNHGLSFTVDGKAVVLTGDSSFHEQEVACLQDVDLAVIDSGHLEDHELLELAVRSRAAVIVCSHLYRELDEDELNAQASARGYAGRFIVGQDLMPFDLGA